MACNGEPPCSLFASILCLLSPINGRIVIYLVEIFVKIKQSSTELWAFYNSYLTNMQTV